MSDSRTWIIVHEPGMIPEAKGAFYTHERTQEFLRELIACRPVGTTYTVAQVSTCGSQLWVQSGDEFLWLEHASPRKASAVDPLAGLRIQVRQRLQSAIRHLKSTGTLNRADIQRIGEITAPQASADINLIKQRFPDLMAYDASAKCYRLVGQETP